MVKYNDIISAVAEKTGIPKKVVDKSYKAYWKAVREHITSLPLKKDLTDEEFSKLQPNVNIPSIGKLYVTKERYRSLKNQHKYIKEHRNVTHQEG